MNGHVDNIVEMAKAEGWKVNPSDANAIQKMGFESGTELISPSGDLHITILESASEFFCDIGGYARLEYPRDHGNKPDTDKLILATLQNIFVEGVTVEIYRSKKDGHILRSKVLHGGEQNKRVIAKTVNRFGFFGGNKEMLHLGA